MIILPEIPSGLEEILDTYGNPDLDGDFMLDTSFVEHNISVFPFPFPMPLSWNPSRVARRFQAHVSVGPVIVDALEEIRDHKGWQYLQDNRFDYYGGCFNFRLKRNGKGLSTHSWAVAIDINPNLAPFGERNHGQPDFIIEAFTKRNFEWGGNWSVCDAQHFQACVGY